MLLTELRVENLRNVVELQLEPAPGVSLFTGANGAGKTSVLEAVYVLSHACSFRTRRAELLVGDGGERLSVFGVIAREAGWTARLGLSHRGGRWVGKIDGRAPATLAAVLEHCAAVCFDPGAHALISGGSDERRRFLDWGVFHVEPEHAETARRYQRALRQRNRILRARGPDSELDVWDELVAAAARPVRGARDRYLVRLDRILRALLEEYLPELGEARIRSTPGWPADAELGAVLKETRGVDRVREHTTRGPHRADWSIRFERAMRREHLSRGQEKLCAIACVLAQAMVYREDHSEWPIVLLDDLPSELDKAHQDRVIRSLGESQILMTSTDVPEALQRTATSFRRFHVEQGRVKALV